MDGIFYDDAQGVLQFSEVDDLSVDDANAVQTRSTQTGAEPL